MIATTYPHGHDNRKLNYKNLLVRVKLFHESIVFNIQNIRIINNHPIYESNFWLGQVG